MNIAKPIIYVTKDIDRALGLAEQDNYSILSDVHTDTLDLLKKVPEGSTILVFKNTIHIERYCMAHNITLLNPSATLAEQIENKITQVKWLGELASLLPPHEIATVKNIPWQTPYILQWAHGHTGEGTLYVENISNIKNIFPDREAKITKYINGPIFTMNVVVGNTIEVGNISYQITGLTPFTDNRFATVGNDWSLAHRIAPKEEIISIAKKVGEKMKASGWKGLFGIDVVSGDRVYLIEINARQPASATYESQLQKTNTVFENHIKALLDEPLHTHSSITDGAQIIDRRTMTWTRSEHGIMKDHNVHDHQTN